MFFQLSNAIDVLETRMLKEDKVKPDRYIYNLLISGCARYGYTKKAFSLFNDVSTLFAEYIFNLMALNINFNN